MNSLEAAHCTYTECYCEENVWKLCERISHDSPHQLSRCYAVFISNDNKMVPLWYQKASKPSKSGFVVWDYHVILIIENRDDGDSSGTCQVYDLDTTLPFPCEFRAYATNTFKDESKLHEQYHRIFRVVPASDYLNHFASDRSHMLDSNGEWLKEPPSYPCIRTGISQHNLPDYISMDSTRGIGQVLTLKQLISRFQ